MLFGLFAALSATTLLDLSTDKTSGEDKDEAQEADTASDYEETYRQIMAEESAVGAAEEQGIGQFDLLGERIHSSDDYAPRAPVAPSFQVADAQGAALRGDVADDTLIGGLGDDRLIGAGGNNLMAGIAGQNDLLGGEGDDILIGGTGNDTLQGGWGDDLIVAGGGDNLLFGGAGHDTLVGVQFDAYGQDISGQNTLNGGAGNDVLIAGQGDVLHGGEGNDGFVLGSWLVGQAPTTIVDFTPGEDQIVISSLAGAAAPGDVQIVFQPFAPNVAEIYLHGALIAYVPDATGLTVDDLVLRSDTPDPFRIAAE